MSRREEDAAVARFFALNGLIAQQERIAGDPQSAASVAADARAASAVLRAERCGSEEHGRGDPGWAADARDQGGGADAAHRRRYRVAAGEHRVPGAAGGAGEVAAIGDQEARATSLLQGDLPIARVQAIESEAERDGKTSALVVEIGGIAMYPAIIPFDEDYHFILQDIAHEWMHHYLFFAPLGRAYFDSAKLTTLNETVANMVGRELGDMLFARVSARAGAVVRDDRADCGSGKREAGAGSISRRRCGTCGGRWSRCWRTGRSTRRSGRWRRSGSSWRRTGTTSGG